MKSLFSLIFPAWLVVCFLGALPFYFSGFFPSFTDAFFESASGFTTTGATLVSDVEALPNWLLLWRSMTQWLGGAGILLTFIMLPVFSTGGFQLEKINAAGLDSRSFDRGARHTVGIVLLIYAVLTALQFFLLVIFGMHIFDALTTSFSTMSTGGFSVRNNGIAHYNSPAVEWVCAAFMLLAGINFSLIWLFLLGKASGVMRNSETRAYAAITAGAAVFITVLILAQGTPGSVGAAFRQAFFHAASIISTTGFYSCNYNLWPSAAQGVLFFLLFTGGCSFSAAAGIKIIRWLLLSRQTWKEMKRLVYPRGVFIIRLDGRDWNKRAVHGAAGFVILYFAAVFLAGLLVSSGGAGVFTSINTALVCLGNVGRGLGELGAFAFFPDFPSYVKWGLSFVMILGRLELWIVLVIFTKDFWRR